jgi:hypothetical protein
MLMFLNFKLIFDEDVLAVWLLFKKLGDFYY